MNGVGGQREVVAVQRGARGSDQQDQGRGRHTRHPVPAQCQAYQASFCFASQRLIFRFAIDDSFNEGFDSLMCISFWLLNQS